MIARPERRGRGPEVIFVHGVGLDRRMWDGVVDRLSARFTCITFDLPGHGETPMPSGEMTLGRFAESLAEIAREAQKPAVVGFSMGAMIAQRFALDHPDRVSRLVLMNAVHDRSTAQRAAVEKRLETALEHGPAALIEAAVSRWFTRPDGDEIAATVEAVRRRLETNDPRSFLAAYAVFARADAALAAPAREIACPTLVMTGERDVNSTPEMSQALAAAIPQASAAILPGLAHGAPMEAPAKVASAIEAFLS